MDELHQLWPEARDVFAGLAEPHQLAPARYRDPIMRRWHRGRVVLIGDAAHAMSPQLEQGVNLARLVATPFTTALHPNAAMQPALLHTQRPPPHHHCSPPPRTHSL